MILEEPTLEFTVVRGGTRGLLTEADVAAEHRNIVRLESAMKKSSEGSIAVVY